MISSAELIIYLNNEEENIAIPLSPTQLKGIVKLLGIEYSGGHLRMFSDEGVKTIMSKTLDKLVEV